MGCGLGCSKPLGISSTCPETGKEENNPKRQLVVAAQTLLPGHKGEEAPALAAGAVAELSPC